MKGQMYLRKLGFLARVGAQLVAHPENNVHRLEGADPDLPMMSASSSSSPFETCQSLGVACSKSNTLGASFPPPARSSLVQRFSRNSLRRASVGSQSRTEPEPAAPVPHSATASPPTMDLELDVHAVGVGLRFLEWESGLRGLQVTPLEPQCAKSTLLCSGFIIAHAPKSESVWSCLAISNVSCPLRTASSCACTH